MTIAQLIDDWTSEKIHGVTSRFPCRAVMVSNIAEYRVLLDQLLNIPGAEMVPSEWLFNSDDVLPSYENLKHPAYKDRWLILPGVSEYLRLFSKGEVQRPRFGPLWRYMGAASSKGRIIIPLWGCSAQWYDKDLHLNDDERQRDYFIDLTDDTASEQDLNILVLARQFEQYGDRLATGHNKVFRHLTAWYQYWTSPQDDVTEQVVITGRSRNIQSSMGSTSVRVIGDILSFDREYLQHGEKLTPDNCPDEAAALLFDSALKRMDLNQAILTSLNILQFKAGDVLSKWHVLSRGEKQLAMLWLRLNKSNDYLSYCIGRSQTPEEFENHICHDIFSVRAGHEGWEQEAQQWIAELNLPKDEAYYADLDLISDYTARLPYLTGNSQKEQVYLLHMVGEWMRTDAEQVMQCKELQRISPELFSYLQSVPELKDADYDDYFKKYKSYKLSNRLPEDESLYFAGYEMDGYDYRYATLSKYTNDDCCILWIDALGAEWLSLLYPSLSRNVNATITHASITRAMLPTETEYNDQWNQMGEPHYKLDKLDKLAHKGVIDDPSYYACIEEQFEFVSTTIPQKVNELLGKYQRVIVTGDHGTSRLAARFFHERSGYHEPKGSLVRSHGRYCELGENSPNPATNQIVEKHSNGKRYLLFKNYDHFTRSGFAAGGDDDNAQYGELHGGATPEEALVPVIVIDSKLERPLIAKWKNASIKFSAKKVQPTVCFSKPVHNLHAQMGTVEGQCMPTDSTHREWTIILKENKAEASMDHKYQVTLVADGNLVTVSPLEIKPALGGGDFDLL